MITHRRTAILTYNPNFDFGAVYTNTAFIGLVRIMLLFKLGGHLFSGMIINYSDTFSGAHGTL